MKSNYKVTKIWNSNSTKASLVTIIYSSLEIKEIILSKLGESGYSSFAAMRMEITGRIIN